MDAMAFWNYFLEMWYVLIGFIFIGTGINTFKTSDTNKKYGALIFWFILAFLFIVGPYVPHQVNGVLILGLGIISLTKSVNIGDIEQIAQSFKDEQSNIIGAKIFIPSLIIGIGAFTLSQFLPMIAPAKFSGTSIGYIAIGISGVVGLFTVYAITKAPAVTVVKDSTRLMRTMGSYAILPQLLSALGSVFTAAGVGTLIASLMGGVIPADSAFFGAMAYCLGMAIFTMIMGNSFAAFTVITAGIGVPFVFAIGGDPIIASALAMTAGFCGTLLTPMAANFNIVSATLLETKNEYTVIKYQAPFAIVLLIVHIFLMYFLAF